jgi:hypothetical protein
MAIFCDVRLGFLPNTLVIEQIAELSNRFRLRFYIVGHP